MKTFIKVFVTFFLSAYTFASFCAWDFTDITRWNSLGRGLFLGSILFISASISALIEDNKA